MKKLSPDSFLIINEIFLSTCNLAYINETNDVKLRNIKNGISIQDAILYRFKYAQIDSTKDEIVSTINYNNKTNFVRSSYESKENNIGLRIYNNLLAKIKELYFNYFCDNKQQRYIAIDGTYNLNYNYELCLNESAYDIINGVPICINHEDKTRNNEINSIKKIILNNLSLFKNNILIFDRAYHSSNFFDFLDEHNIKFIIRCRNNIKLNDRLNNYNIVSKEFKKTVGIPEEKKQKNKTDEKLKLVINSTVKLITNIKDNESDDYLFNLYNSRWDIEVFFKILKTNFKFSKNTEINKESIAKNHVCELIIMYIVAILKKYILANNTKLKKINDINSSNLITGLFHYFMKEIINGQMTEYNLTCFIKTWTKININKPNRYFNRTAKMPFKKWYVKSYSANSQNKKIMKAIQNNSINDLNKNLKLIANKATIINLLIDK